MTIYDERLADRVREQLAGEPDVSERPMFGIHVFLLAGNMAVGLSREGLMVRVGADAIDDALSQPHAHVPQMGRRPMKNWVAVAPEAVATDRELGAWVRRGVQLARALPPKE